MINLRFFQTILAPKLLQRVVLNKKLHKCVQPLSVGAFCTFPRFHSTTSNETLKWRPLNLCGFSIETGNTAGSLNKVLQIFADDDVNLTHIESRVSPLRSTQCGFHIHVEGEWQDAKIKKSVQQIESLLGSKVALLRSRNVPWFPVKISDIDLFSKTTLDAGAELNADHPGFHDEVYRKRREEIANLAINYTSNQPIPLIDYTDVENKVWNIAYTELTRLYEAYACEEYQEALKALEEENVYSPYHIPQLRHISDHLRKKTGFTLRPVAGLLSGRDFLNALAFRVFFSTQYIRHQSVPLYTPEPDVIHELMGHAPMLANPHFAEFSQLIGLASLGATDEQIRLLATVYWFSVEFGLIYQNNQLKAYGAGLLSSFGELQFSTSPTNEKCEIREWNPFVASTTSFTITTYQPIYFAASSLEDVKLKVLEFCQFLQKPFSVCYHADTQSVVTNVRVNPTPVSLKF